MRIDPNKSENIKDLSLCFISISNEALIKVKHVILINVSYLFFCFFILSHICICISKGVFRRWSFSYEPFTIMLEKKKEAKTIFNSDHEFCNEFKKNSLPLNMKFLFLSKKNRLMHKSLI